MFQVPGPQKHPKSATAELSLVLQRRQLQGSRMSTLLENHKDVISYKTGGRLHGQEIPPAKSRALVEP